jgi:nucleoside-diphosphate-sugar epimerase
MKTILITGGAGFVGSHVRKARSRRLPAGHLLRWSTEDLARESALGVNTIRRAELAEGATSLTAANDLSVRRALEAAGVEFIDKNGSGPGVRLRN